MPAQFPIIFGIAAIVLIAIAIAILVALYAWMTGPFALTRSYGYKLEIPFKSAEGTGRAAAVAIGRSLKRRRA